MDADLDAMRSIGRYRECVSYLLEPLLKKRNMRGMPCKHFKTLAAREKARRLYCEDQGIDGFEDSNGDDVGYCDCIPFNRRFGNWEICA